MKNSKTRCNYSPRRSNIYTPVPNPTQPNSHGIITLHRRNHLPCTPKNRHLVYVSSLCTEGEGLFSLIEKQGLEDSRFRVSLLHHLFITRSRIGTSNTIIIGNVGAAGVNVMAKIPTVTTIWRSVYMWIPPYPLIPCGSGGSSLDGLC